MSSANDAMIEPLLDLQRLTAGVRWRRRMWVGLALAGLVGGVLAGTLLPGAAEASAQIYVVHEAEQSSDSEASTKADLALLNSTSVAREAIARAPIDGPAESYVDVYSGEVVAANVLRVTAPGANPEQAVANTQALADAFVAVYVRQSGERARAEVQALGNRRQEVQRELAELTISPNARSSAAGLGPSAGTDRVTALNEQLSAIARLTVQAEIGTPQIAAGTMVIDTARLTSRPPLVSAILYGLIGLLAGLAGGLTLAVLLTIVRDRPVLRRDIGAHLGASVIAQVPALDAGRLRLRRGARAFAERRRVAGILARLVRCGDGPVSILELGCRPTATELVVAIADELVATGAHIVILDGLPDGGMDGVKDHPDGAVRIVRCSESAPPAGPAAGERQLGVGTLAPGTCWTDLRRLGAETIVVLRAGNAEASWLHTVARQLADEGIAIIGVAVVKPDPRDRSDGTLWDPLHTAIRGRTAAASCAVPVDPPTQQLPALVNGSQAPPPVHPGTADTDRANGTGTAMGGPCPTPGTSPADTERPTMRLRPVPRPRAVVGADDGAVRSGNDVPANGDRSKGHD